MRTHRHRFNRDFGIRIHRDCLDAHGNYVPTPAVASGAFLEYLKRTGYFRTPPRTHPVCAEPGCTRRVSTAGKRCHSCAAQVANRTRAQRLALTGGRPKKGCWAQRTVNGVRQRCGKPSRDTSGLCAECQKAYQRERYDKLRRARRKEARA